MIRDPVQFDEGELEFQNIRWPRRSAASDSVAPCPAEETTVPAQGRIPRFLAAI